MGRMFEKANVMLQILFLLVLVSFQKKKLVIK